jgi:thymidylate synthase
MSQHLVFKPPSWETKLFELYNDILLMGDERVDRTGTGTLGMFGGALTVNLNDGFPLVTSKSMNLRSIISELLWFIEGSGDERRLAELHHGTRDPSKKTIWSPNAERTTGSTFKPAYPGDLGEVYGVQWRHWPTMDLKDHNDFLSHPDGGTTYFGAKVTVGEVDQLANLIDGLKKKPHDRRHVLSAWNVGRLDHMALPPCHMFAQFYVNNAGYLSCQMYQRSVDTFLGLPFNVASYAALVHIIAHLTHWKPGALKIVMGDTHIYKDHVEQVKLQLTNPIGAVPTMRPFRKDIKTLEDFTVEDFVLDGYVPGPVIKARMSA